MKNLIKAIELIKSETERFLLLIVNSLAYSAKVLDSAFSEVFSLMLEISGLRGFLYLVKKEFSFFKPKRNPKKTIAQAPYYKLNRIINFLVTKKYYKDTLEGTILGIAEEYIEELANGASKPRLIYKRCVGYLIIFTALIGGKFINIITKIVARKIS